MASRSGIEAGRTFVSMFLDSAELEASLKGVQAKLRATGAALQRTGAEMVSLGSKVLLPFVAALAVFIPFSDRMKEVQAVTQATAVEFDRLNEQAKALGRSTSFTAAQVAGAMAELGRAGFDTSQIQAATEHTLNLARASGTELPRAAEIMASTLNQFGLAARDSQQVADTLTATVNGSAQGMEDLAEALKPVAPIAAEAGATLEETSAAIGILANNGIKGSLAGNALARAYKNLSTPATRKELDKLGVSVVDASGNLRALTDIIGDISQATENFGNADRLAAFEGLFGRGQAAALKLAGAVTTTAERLQRLESPAAQEQLQKLGISLQRTSAAMRPLQKIADDAGATLIQTAAAAKALEVNGLSSAEAGDALAKAYANLRKTDTRKELDRLGVSVVDASGNLQSMTSVLVAVTEATAGMSEDDRLAAFETVFGRGEMAAVKLAREVQGTAEQMERLASPDARRELEQLGVSLTDSAGEAKSLGEVFEEVKARTAGLSNQERKLVFETIGFDDLLSKIKLWDNAAAETAATMDGGVGGSFHRMMSAIKDVAIALAEAVEGPATEWMEWVGELSGGISKFISQNRALVTLIAKVGTGLVIVGGGFLAAAAAVRVVTLAVALYQTTVKAAAAAQATLMSLAGPKGWALVAAGVAVAAGGMYALNQALKEDEAAAVAAADEADNLTDKITDAKAAVDEVNAAGPPDLTPRGGPELDAARDAVQRLTITMAGLRGETERAVRVAAAGDALKTLALLGGDPSKNPADRVADLLQTAIPASEKLKAKLMEVEAAFSLLEQPVNPAAQAQLRLSIIDQSTGAVSAIKDLQKEIAVLEGRATDAGLKMRDMLQKGVPPDMVQRFQQLADIRDKLAAQQQADEAAERDRQQLEKQQLTDLRSRADQIKEQNTTADERIEIELAELEQLRAAIDPENNTPLLDEETYRRELERLHARQIEIAAQDAKRINGGSAQQLSNNDLRSQGGANLIADLFNGRVDISEQQLRELQSFNRNIRDLYELTESRQLIRKAVF